MRRGFRPYSFYARIVATEAPIEKTEAGLVAAGDGWFVVNAREARWFHREGRGELLPLTGNFEADDEAEWHRVQSFPQFGVNLFVLAPGEPIAVYHGEDAQEAFLVLGGEGVLVIEGQERSLRQWDFVHAPPWTEHTIVGAGDGPCVVLAVGTRASEAIRFPANEAAAKYGASSQRDTADGGEAYARFPSRRDMQYREGLLPS
jgi:uncharacterized cupin superfamily protein